MRLRRRSNQPTRRQRVIDDSPANLTGYSYSSRQAQSERVSRQPPANQTVRRLPGKSFWLQRSGLLILLAAVFISTINILRLSPNVEVIPLNATASHAYLQPTKVYAAAANKFLKQSVWNRSKVTVDASGVSQQLLRQFPELNHASLTVPLLSHRPLVYIQAVQPALILHTSGGMCVLDETGKVMATINYVTIDTASLPQVTDQSGLPFKLRQQALSASDVHYIQVVVAELAAKQFTVSTMTLPAASRELDVSPAGQPYFVKFNLDDNDPAGEAGSFLATVASLKKQNITPAQYVDVRLSGRAYYR